MSAPIDWYAKNPMTSGERRRARAHSTWVQSFSCEDVRPLIVCRGPIRKEAMDVFEEMGITHYGILLSEKDSIVYPQALAPELRSMRSEHVHRVKDYTGAGKEERLQRMAQAMHLDQASDLGPAIKDMNARLGLPSGLAEMGVTSDMFDRIIDGAAVLDSLQRAV